MLQPDAIILSLTTETIHQVSLYLRFLSFLYVCGEKKNENTREKKIKIIKIEISK